MIKIENVEVVGWEHAIRGMRNPLNSWDKSDSGVCEGADGFEDCTINAIGECPRHSDFRNDIFCVGKADYELMKRLVKAGTDHRKFMRMIVVYVDVTAPMYWWKEFDTYKVGTVRNSCSTMHTITDKEFTIDDFSTEHLFNERIIDEFSEDFYDSSFVRCDSYRCLRETITTLNFARKLYLRAKDKPMKDNSKRDGLMKKLRWQIIQLLPSSYNQKATLMLNYEVLANIYHSRKNHRLDEWRDFCAWIESLPYSELITGSESNGI